MLYDNSQLARVYLHTWQVTGNEFFRTITEEILDYVAREMIDLAGGFYSTQDADSEGEEGKFFTWTMDEIHEVLGDEADEFIEAYGVKDGGNWEGKNILELTGSQEQRATLADALAKLFAVRETRIHPNRDEKVLTSWNGLMLAAFAEAARVFSPSPGTGRGGWGVRAEAYRMIAERNAEFLLRELRNENGRLLRTWKACPKGTEGTGEAKLNGYLEDYAYLIEGLLELYQTTFDAQWFVAAQQLAETILAHFQASEGGFFDTGDDHEALITRPRDLQDNTTSSGNAMATTVLLKLAGLTNKVRYVDISQQALGKMQPMMSQYPLGFGQWLQALRHALSKPREIAIVCDPDSADTQALLNVVRDGHRPLEAVAPGAPDAQSLAVPLLQDRGPVNGGPAAYVCPDFTYQAPVTEPAELQAQLASR